MPKIFISYRRKSSSFTLLLANKLSERLDADIFVDFASIDQADFEHAILHHLKASDVFLLMVTEHTFAERIHRADDWVRKEIRTALEDTIPIILVCENGLFPPADLPDDVRPIRGKQGIEFYPAYFDAAVERLVDFLGKVAQIPRKVHLLAPQALPVPLEQVENLQLAQKTINTSNAQETLAAALEADAQGDFAQALFLLEALEALHYKPKRFNVAELITDISKAHAHEKRKRLASADYEEIALFAKNPRSLKRALAEFQQWAKDYPEFVEELDSANLRQKLEELRKPKPVENTPLPVQRLGEGQVVRKPTAKNLLPAPFDWCPIPAGKVILESGGYLDKATTFEMPAFEIAKYSVTNAQYWKFIEAGGYKNKDWWTNDGWKQREKDEWTEPRYWQDKKFNGANQPVVGVSWYESVAFCTWLSSVTGDKILLPTEQKWQRAAQAKRDGGNTQWMYVWGDGWDGKKCNNSVSTEKKTHTSLVTHYEKLGNASPCGVVDLIGNVWEWCLTEYATGKRDINGTNVRCLRGASWNLGNSNYFRAAYRDNGYPHNWSGDVGFRLSRFN